MTRIRQIDLPSLRAFELCRTLRGTLPAGSPPFLAPEDKRFPILIRGADLAALLAADKSPKPPVAPDWIPYFLGKHKEDYKWGVSESFFQGKLESGGCLIILDGLDEAPERRMRRKDCPAVGARHTGLPEMRFPGQHAAANECGDSVLAGFHPIRIGDLELADIRIFVDHVARALAVRII